MQKVDPDFIIIISVRKIILNVLKNIFKNPHKSRSNEESFVKMEIEEINVELFK